jgi:methionine-rich copper-binding protein CopC
LAEGSTVQSAPQQVTLTFSEKLEPAFSTIEVRNAAGGRVDQGKVTVSATTMSVGLTALPPGSYTVSWRVLSVDTHTAKGIFGFRVGK